MEKLSEKEKPGPKEFGFKVLPFEGHLGVVPIEYNGEIYVWYLREDDGRTVILRSGNIAMLTAPVREAMEEQVRAILGPIWRKRKTKLKTSE